MNKSALVTAAALSLTFVVACEQAPVEAPEVVRPVRILTIAPLQGGDSVSYPGEIQGAQNVNIGFEVPGRIVEMPVQEGVEVNQGDVLARLDPSDFQSSLDAAAARARASKETFERFSEVFERGAISAQELDMRRRQYEVEQANLATAQKSLDDTVLRAPFTGRVGRTFVDNFNNVQAKQEILLLQDLTEFEVVVNVPEQDWLRADAEDTSRSQSLQLARTFFPGGNHRGRSCCRPGDEDLLSPRPVRSATGCCYPAGHVGNGHHYGQRGCGRPAASYTRTSQHRGRR
jgi:multidrug efflux pump subunit AcrA (membrane-fusion protein)